MRIKIIKKNEIGAKVDKPAIKEKPENVSRTAAQAVSNWITDYRSARAARLRQDTAMFYGQSV